jgi:hypothetical protein
VDVALHRFGDPVSIPHDIENREVATGIDRERIRRSAALFRLRRRSQSCPAQPLKVETRVRTPLGLPANAQVSGLSSLSDDSALPFVPHLSRGRPRHVTSESPRGRPGRVGRSTQSRRGICSRGRGRDEIALASQDHVEGNGPRADRHSRQGAAHEGPTTARTGAFVSRQRRALGEDNRRSISSGSATWARLGAVLWAGAGSQSGPPIVSRLGHPSSGFDLRWVIREGRSRARARGLLPHCSKCGLDLPR